MNIKAGFSIFFIPAFLLIVLSVESCVGKYKATILESPGKQIGLNFMLNENGSPIYTVSFNGEKVIDKSLLGLEFMELPGFTKDFLLSKVTRNAFNETYKLPWGEKEEVKNHYNEVTIHLEKEVEGKTYPLKLHFRAFDDGCAFRYEIPKIEGKDSVKVINEKTHFNLTDDATCWWIPGDWDIYEHLVTKSKFSEIDALSKRDHPNLAQTYIPNNAVNTPFTIQLADRTWMSFHEANLTNYPGMTLKVDNEKFSMESELVGSERKAYKAAIPLPFSTPWRTIQITEKACELVESDLIINLNEANKLGNVDWFKPMKYMGIWWEMHIGHSTWNMNSGIHGANTKNAMRYIDFAAKNNIGGVLVEGWNTGWDHWIGFDDREGVFDFVTPYDDYDLQWVVQYAKSKGVEIIMHHETSAAPRTYDQQLDTAFTLMQDLGLHAVKTGYVGPIIPEGEYHHGQWMVNHYRRVIESAAKHQVAVNAHEPIKATGIRRTYPNIISREGLRGQEFNAWASDGGNPPEHISNVVFTRMLAGPIDFTPGAFEMSLPLKPDNQINTTLAHQLALYVVINSPIQMACDLPEHYAGQPAFQFIRDVGVNWKETKVLDGYPGDFVVIAREERNTKNWFIGGVSDEKSRSLNLKFDFLPANKEYLGILYRDGERAHYQNNPTDIVIDTIPVSSTSSFEIYLAEGGGFALSLLKK